MSPILQGLFKESDKLKINQQNINARKSTVNINQPRTAQSSSGTTSQPSATTEPTLTQALQSIIDRIT